MNSDLDNAAHICFTSQIKDLKIRPGPKYKFALEAPATVTQKVSIAAILPAWRRETIHLPF